MAEVKRRLWKNLTYLTPGLSYIANQGGRPVHGRAALLLKLKCITTLNDPPLWLDVAAAYLNTFNAPVVGQMIEKIKKAKTLSAVEMKTAAKTLASCMLKGLKVNGNDSPKTVIAGFTGCFD